MCVGPLELTVEDYQQISKEIFNKVNLSFSESQTRVTNSMTVHRKDVYALSTIHGTEESKMSWRNDNDINKPLKSSGNTRSI